MLLTGPRRAHVVVPIDRTAHRSLSCPLAGPLLSPASALTGGIGTRTDWLRGRYGGKMIALLPGFGLISLVPDCAILVNFFSRLRRHVQYAHGNPKPKSANFGSLCSRLRREEGVPIARIVPIVPTMPAGDGGLIWTVPYDRRNRYNRLALLTL